MSHSPTSSHAGISRSDLREIRGTLYESEAAWIEEHTQRTNEKTKKEVRTHTKEIEKAIDEA